MTCRSSGKTFGPQKLDVQGDSGDAAYLTFPISYRKMAQVKVGTNSGRSSFFLTTGISAVDLALNKSIFTQGETISEISGKDGLRSVQIYSPEFVLDGALKMLKATISFR